MNRTWPAQDSRLEALSAPPEFYLDPALAFDDPLVASLLTLWESRYVGERLPARSDFTVTELQPYFGWLCLLRVNPDRQDLVYSLVGTRIVDLVGRDNTGKAVGASMPSWALETYLCLMDTPRPVRSWGTVNWRGRDFLKQESLMLPLATDGRTVDQFLTIMTVR
ncbi:MULTISPECIES: PAS domain-containing protein [unclassified Minwuia]|jgi:hypothetical protein|uniref:PAS domain-containing protein n=1 Tax=unclassified Minwuia TaxID=2618799 RepID=UPI00247996B6|nr:MULTISPECIES: PAS domain-containing protein [unclassified Minwuia]